MSDAGFLPRTELRLLLDALTQAGYRCIGPRARDGAIIYDTVASVDDLPRGVRDAQAPGHYRLAAHDGARCFAWANGPQALKPFVFRPHETLWSAHRSDNGDIRFEPAVPDAEPLAIIGVRACDLAALALQDRHFLPGDVVDRGYAARRQQLFLVAVDCSHPADTCFCASTGDGPRVADGFDLALSELDDGFVVRAGSDRGAVICAKLPCVPVTGAQHDQVGREHDQSVRSQTRRLASRDLRDRLFAALAHPRWQEVGARCLSCGNCTSVCPTCFCHAEAEEPVLDGRTSAHVRRWDSCFTQNHSYIHGVTIRPDARTRYRQWLTHKLGSWHEQYGRSGCVGCGRCISWCPVGIDITEEANAICGGET